VRLCLWTAATNRPTCLFPTWYEHGTKVEWYWHGKAEELIKEPVPLPLCPPQIPQRLTWASMVRCRRLTTWAMALPGCHVKILAWWHYLIKLTYFDRREALWDESKNSLLLAYNHSVKLFHCLKVLYLNHDALEVGSAFIFRWPLEGQKLIMLGLLIELTLIISYLKKNFCIVTVLDTGKNHLLLHKTKSNSPIMHTVSAIIRLPLTLVYFCMTDVIH
jgi:hypothetical protein